MLWIVLLLALAWLVWIVCRARRRSPARSSEDASTWTDNGSRDDDCSVFTGEQVAAVGATLLACSADVAPGSDSDSRCSDAGGDSGGSDSSD